MNHISIKQLQDVAVGTIRQDETRLIEAHLQVCPECKKQMILFRQTDLSLRSMPLERVSSDFTQSLMKALHIEDTPSLLWIFLKNFAPVVALTVVAGVTFAVLSYTGVFQDNQSSITNVQGAFQQAEKSLSDGIQAFNAWVGTYMPFAFAKDSIGLTGFLLAFFGGVALLDKFILMPRLRKRT